MRLKLPLLGDSAALLPRAEMPPVPLLSQLQPQTVGVALKLIETYGIEISDEVRELA